MNNKKVLAGAKLAGGNPENGRVEDDYYATNPEAVKMLLTKYTFDAHTILEPCVGGGHIANAINDFYTTKREITGIEDILEQLLLISLHIKLIKNMKELSQIHRTRSQRNL